MGADSQEHHSTLPLKALLKNRLLSPLLHTLFPIMAAEPPLGQLDPEDHDSEEEELEIGLVGEMPKHFAVQVGYGTRAGGRALGGCRRLWGRDRVQQSLLGIFQVVDMLALHLPPEKLCPVLVSVALFLWCTYPQMCLVPQGQGYLGPGGYEGPLVKGMGRLMHVLEFQKNALCSLRCPCWKRPCRARAHIGARLDSWCWLCCPMELATTSGRGVYSLVLRVDHGSPGLHLSFMPNYQ